MKRYLIFTMFMIAASSNVLLACDQCSCSSGATFNNVSAFATFNYLMSRMGYSSMHGSGDVGSFVSSAQMDIAGGYSLNKRIHLSAYFPLRYNYFSHDGNTHTQYGIGDAGVIANVIVWTNSDNVMKRTTSTCSIRGGIELPTGKFNENFREEDVPAALSTGSGSVDWMGGLRWITKNGNNTLTIDYLAKYNMANAVDYQFGLQQSANVFISRTIRKPGAAWIPYTGVATEWSPGDTYHDYFMAGTSGYNAGLLAGLEYARTNWVFGAHADVPVISNYDTDVNVHPKASIRVVKLFN